MEASFLTTSWSKKGNFLVSSKSKEGSILVSSCAHEDETKLAVYFPRLPDRWWSSTEASVSQYSPAQVRYCNVAGEFVVSATSRRRGARPTTARRDDVADVKQVVAFDPGVKELNLRGAKACRGVASGEARILCTPVETVAAWESGSSRRVTFLDVGERKFIACHLPRRGSWKGSSEGPLRVSR
ncbi:carbonic anhydrase [Striga asiatica]|uniref:Carbonic anhydrase n=1 Tax=Striga asiatica TaxID=4170 RepID=A0A5A7PEH1_STRAF|nr:carbonic anhydrase [Striga asiatica]